MQDKQLITARESCSWDVFNCSNTELMVICNTGIRNAKQTDRLQLEEAVLSQGCMYLYASTGFFVILAL